MEDDDFEGIPDNGDIWLFAEDLMTHILRRELNYPEEVYTVADFRDFLYNAFDDNMAHAVNFLMDQTCTKSYVFSEHPTMSREVFLTLASNRRQKYFSHGFDARLFLYYCVHIGSLAIVLRKANFFEAPMLGVECIAVALNQFNMSTGGWDVLRNVAAEYAKMYYDHRVDTNGRTDMNESYTSTHLKNPDFLSATESWKHEVYHTINAFTNS